MFAKSILLDEKTSKEVTSQESKEALTEYRLQVASPRLSGPFCVMVMTTMQLLTDPLLMADHQVVLFFGLAGRCETQVHRGANLFSVSSPL